MQPTKKALVHWEAYVGNIGNIGNYRSRSAAIRACKETIDASARADNNWWVIGPNSDDVYEGIHHLRKPKTICPHCRKPY